MTDRWVDVDGMHNVRDLGGIPLLGGGETARGVVLRGETVVHLTDAGGARLRELGVRHVLDLREPDERALDGNGPLDAAYQRSDLLHEAVGLAGGPVDEDPVGRVLDTGVVADRYWQYLSHGSFRLAEALARTAWSRCALYVHCAVGKDRTGVVSSLLLSLAGAEEDAIIDDHVLTSQRLRPVVERLGQRRAYAHLAHPDWPAQEPDPDAMRGLLARLRARGGAQHWMLDHGVDSETLDLLVSRLRGEPLHARRVG